MSTLLTILAELLKSLLPAVLNFTWEKSHEPTTVEEAKPDDARRDRLLAAIRRMRDKPGGDGAEH